MAIDDVIASGHADRRRRRRRSSDERLDEHERRITALELRQNTILGGVALAIAQLGIVIFQLFTHHF